VQDVQMTVPHSDHGGFERFFLDEHPKLVALGLAWTGDRELARDTAQEALTRAYRAWSTVALLDLPGAWARRVMINLLIDQHRHAGRQLRLVAQLDREATTSIPDPAGPWWDAVRELPERERAAVTLHYLEDLSIDQVAAILEVKPGTVKSSLSHAREKLRAALAEHHGSAR
jgi:RNA polymerase sigma-70 factor (ECF subfamily)